MLNGKRKSEVIFYLAIAILFLNILSGCKREMVKSNRVSKKKEPRIKSVKILKQEQKIQIPKEKEISIKKDLNKSKPKIKYLGKKFQNKVGIPSSQYLIEFKKKVSDKSNVLKSPPKRKIKQNIKSDKKQKLDFEKKKKIVQEPKIITSPKSSPNILLIPGVSYNIEIKNFVPEYPKTTKNEISLYLEVDSNFIPKIELFYAEPNDLFLDIPNDFDLENPPYPHIDETKCNNNLVFKTLSFELSSISRNKYHLNMKNLLPGKAYCFKVRLSGNGILKDSGIIKERTLREDFPENGMPITFTGKLTKNAIFTEEFSPYYLPEDWVIEKGVVAEFEKGVLVNVGEGVKIVVKGEIKSYGTSVNPVIFRGLGSWEGFEFLGDSKEKSNLDNLIIEGI